jgi:hypothetical protein
VIPSGPISGAARPGPSAADNGRAGG